MNKTFLYILVVFVAFLTSCSPARHVPQDKYLLNRIRIDSDIKRESEANLRQYLKQTPNSRSFGLFRMRLGIYNMSGRDSAKWINRFFRKIGDPPVIYDEMLTEMSGLEMKRYLGNKGFINAAVEHDVNFRRRKADVHFTVTGNIPYRIRDFSFGIRNDSILNIIQRDSANSLIRRNMLFDTDVLNAERQRITTLLRQHGYWNFNRDNIGFVADSTLNSHEVDVTMMVRRGTRTEADGSVITVPHRQYYVRNIRIFTSYDPIESQRPTSLDSVVHDNYVIYFDERLALRPDLLADNNHIERSARYNELQVDRTYSSFNSLSAIRYVNIRFREIAENSDSLDCMILISPARKQAYSIDIEGTNTTGNFGFATNLAYNHKNLFRGSEFFRVSLRLAHESVTESLSGLLRNSSNEISTETSLNFPKFLFPFLSRDFRHQVRASTEFKVGYNYQIRPDFERTIASAGTRYLWSSKQTRRHIVDLIDINYLHLPRVSDAFRDQYLNSNSILRYSYENQLIVLSSYTLFIGNQAARKQHDNINARIGFESAGNTLYGLANLFSFRKEDNSFTIGGIKFSQYIKTDFDFSYNQYIDRRNNVVYHVGVGVGVPYGNMNVLPFEKRYISGGANSVRGWAVRTLGPGVYKPSSDKIDYMNQSGDIKLNLNLEYRFKMFWLLEGALFADAGNIWTIQAYNTQEGGEFKFNEFYKQLALGYGAGVRFDFTYFLVRVDMGIKAFNPILEGASKWRFNGLNWNDDFAFHFAVGYPF